MQAYDGGSVYLRLSTRAIEQPRRTLDERRKADIVAGGYWLREPSPQTSLVIAYQGVVAPEVIEAAGLIAESRPGIGVLALTSSDRLYSGWRHASRGASHVEKLLSQVPRDATILTVIDGHPATLSWLGGVIGHRVASLGTDHFGQSGTIGDLYAHFGFDVNGIVTAAEEAAQGRPILRPLGFRRVAEAA
jgi:pyruvate dehydrogenase E1 component